MAASTVARGDHESQLARSRQSVRENLATLRQQLRMEIAFVSRFDGGRRWFDYVDADMDFCPVAPGDSTPLDESYCSRVLDGRLPELIPDTSKVPGTRELAVTEQLPVGAPTYRFLCGDRTGG